MEWWLMKKKSRLQSTDIMFIGDMLLKLHSTHSHTTYCADRHCSIRVQVKAFADKLGTGVDLGSTHDLAKKQ